MTTTYYDVVTRYGVEDRATAPLGRYRRAAERTDRSVAGLHRSTALLAGTSRTLFRVIAPLTGGLTAAAAVGFGVSRSFSNLNQEMNASLRLAAQMNLAFQFEGAATASENFAGALHASRELIRGLTRDAARLPGELSDFIQIANAASGGVFAGGGDARLLRDITARIALAAPNDPSAGRQAMRILFGTASVADSTMFAMMQGAGLLQGRGGQRLDTTAFNALPAAERLRVFDEGLRRLTDNPAFRQNIIRTFDTQIGTLADNLFGPYGIGGQLLRGPFNDLLDWMVEFNNRLEQQTPRIVSSFERLYDHAQASSSILGNSFVARILGKSFDDVGEAISIMLSPFAALLPDPSKGGWIDRMLGEYLKEVDRRTAVRAATSFGEAYANEIESSKRATSRNPPIEQNFTIHVDLKSDVSPEAIAVKVREGMEKVGRHPSTTRRALSQLPEA